MILYIHPESQTMLTEVYPISLPALINRLKYPVRGCFEYELRDEEIRSAKFILMDIHWYTSLAYAILLSRRIKQCNPEVIIIAGGISATLFAKQILRDSEIDYIIRGDAELPLCELIETLVEGGEPEKVPNVVGKGFISPSLYTLTTEDFDAGNYRDISFFPSLEKRVLRLHAQARGKPFATYPFLMAFRGCPFDCNDECYGSPELQKRIFGRYWIIRSADRLREDLEFWDSDNRLTFINIFHDFISLLPMDYTKKILSQRYGLSVYYDFFRCPSEEQLGMLMESFRDGIIFFELDQYHASSTTLVQLDDLIARIKMAQAAKRFNVRLTFNKHFVREDLQYAEALKRVVKETCVWTYNADFWWDLNPVPDPDGWGTEEDYQRCYQQRGKNFFWYNTVYRTGTVVHRYFPRFANMVAKYWLTL